jgi:hypothetical protein
LNQSYRFNQASEDQMVTDAQGQDVAQSASAVETSRTPASANTPAAQTPAVTQTQTPVGSQPPASCLPSGYTIGTGSAQKYIYYRKCDNEIQLWRNQGQQQCCSKSVTITDVSAFYDEYCASLGSADTYRYEGTMVCN